MLLCTTVLSVAHCMGTLSYTKSVTQLFRELQSGQPAPALAMVTTTATHHTPLTTQALHELNLQHSNVDQPAAHQYANSQRPKSSLEVRGRSPRSVAAPGTWTQIVLTMEDTANDTHIISANKHTPHKYGHKMYIHEPLENAGNQDMTGNNVPYKSDPTVNITEYQSSTISTHELTKWGNDLAGVGEHLSDFDSGNYASADDFVVE